MSAPTAEDVIAQAIWFQDQPERNTRLILEALAAAGYAVVPVEPTREMWAKAADALVNDRHGAGSGAHHDHISGLVYRAMIAAAGETKA